MATTAEAILRQKRQPLAYDHLSEKVLSPATRWESYVSRYEKKLKRKLYDVIKFAGLEALAPEELEKSLADPSRMLAWKS